MIVKCFQDQLDSQDAVPRDLAASHKGRVQSSPSRKLPVTMFNDLRPTKLPTLLLWAKLMNLDVANS